MRLAILVTPVLGLAALSFSAHAAPESSTDVPSPEALVRKILQPRKSLRHGDYHLTISGELVPDPVTIRLRFHGDCVRKDTFGQEKKIHVLRQDGELAKFEKDDQSVSVFRESWCDGEAIDYNPIRGIGGRRFAVSVNRPAAETDPAAAEARIKVRFFDPRLIGLEPAQSGLLHRLSMSSILYDDVATSSIVKRVEYNGVPCLLLQQTLDQGQIAKRWVREDQDYAICAAEITTVEQQSLVGCRVEIATQRVPSPAGMMSFPQTIHVYEIRGTDVREILVEQIDKVDFLTEVDKSIFTVEGMEPSEGTHIATTGQPGRVIENGKITPWRPKTNPQQSPPAKGFGRWVWLVFNALALMVWSVIWRRRHPPAR